MDIAGDVVRMLLTRDAEEGRALAEKLHRLNSRPPHRGSRRPATD